MAKTKWACRRRKRATPGRAAQVKRAQLACGMDLLISWSLLSLTEPDGPFVVLPVLWPTLAAEAAYCGAEIWGA